MNERRRRLLCGRAASALGASRTGVRAASVGVVLGAALVLAACGRGSAGTGSTALSGSDEILAQVAPGVDTVTIRLVPPGADPAGGPAGGVIEACVLRADRDAERNQGLMGVTGLEPYDGMLFDYPDLVNGPFWMRDTPLPLSIAFFDDQGRFVSGADMEPCLDRGMDCPLTFAAGPYRYALEVPKGTLPGLGVGPGTHLEFGGACPASVP